MRTRKSLRVAVTVGLLAVTLAPAGPAEAAPSSVPAAGARHTVTLITGDRVTVTGNLAIHPDPSRADITFVGYRDDGHQYVIPSDALALVRDGRLDRRLFDVTLLREFGYDERRSDLPLLITGRHAAAATAEAADRVALPVVDAVAAEVAKPALARFWEDLTDPAEPATRTLADGVSTVWLDGLRRPALDESVPQVGAPAAHAAGLDGSGATVAVLDTGIDTTHPDLADRLLASENFTEGFEDDRDLVGHGTHVASILAGTGQASAGRFRGVAPGASLLNGKVCVDGGCEESWILAGMQWAVEQGADVVNMSLSGPDSPGLDPLEQAVEALTAEFGTLFVVAAGNDGADFPVSSPASAEAAVAVGAVDKADQLAEFSNHGPTGDGALKPDITAPGVDITAANSKDRLSGDPGEPYTTNDGTSMATPHVAGAAAILVQQHPEWTPAQLKAALMGAAAPNPELAPYAQGAGRLDVARAIDQTVTASPPSVGFDRALWPHDDDVPQARTVTYVNDGPEVVTLALGLAATGPDGRPAPDGFFSLDAATVTVLAGGTAEVTVTVDTSQGELDGGFGGYLTATGPGVAVTTPIVVEREVESYDVTLPHTDRDGAPTDHHFTLLLGPERLEGVFDAGPAPTVRMPAGAYALMSIVSDEEHTEETLLANPRLVVDRDQSVAVDARQGRPISVTVPEPSAVQGQGAVTAEVLVDGAGVFPLSVVRSSFDGVFSGQLGPDQTVDGFSSVVSGFWARPNPDNPAGSFAGTPYTYDLAWFELGRMITGFTRDVRPGELATIRADHAVHVPGALGWRTSYGVHPAVSTAWGATIPDDELPFRRTEYHNTDGGVQWRKDLQEVVPGAELDESVSFAESGPTAYRAARTYRERWNQAVFGPVLPEQPVAVSRHGDQLRIAPALYGDQAGRPVSTPATGTITVFRNGARIAEVPELSAVVDLPPEPADYRVEVAAVRDQRFPLSSATRLVWSFRSGHVDGEVSLPVSVVRATPRLDQQNTAPAGTTYLVPVEMVPQRGSAAARPARLTVEVSYDDGASWHRTSVLDGRYALVRHPASPGYVSLRATATDRAGNTVEQTIIRAYAIE